MLPVIAIVGRPNVGKSTLFNRLTSTRDALVGNIPGITRDRQYGEGQIDHLSYIVIDTGGLISRETDNIETSITKQVQEAVSEADAIIFLVDARENLTLEDETIASKLRSLNKNIFLLANKIDGLNKDNALTDFFKLGLGEPKPISAEHNIGVKNAISEIIQKIPTQKAIISKQHEELAQQKKIKVAIIGRPNVGKSTLINSILKKERVIVSEKPGTTRGSIYIDFRRNDKNYVLIDTAGIRKKGKIKEKIEKFSLIKTLKSIETADVAILLADAKENITEQDLRLITFALDAGKALVIAINKWDSLSKNERISEKQKIKTNLTFLDFAEIHFISALHQKSFEKLFTSIDIAYRSNSRNLKTPALTKILHEAVVNHAPAMVRGQRIKLRYAHAGGRSPPLIIIHGNQTEKISKEYRRYLANYFRKKLRLIGTPLRIEFKKSSNPSRKSRSSKKISNKFFR